MSNILLVTVPYTLLSFPVELPEWLVAGITPPHDLSGAILNFKHPDELLPGLNLALGERLWVHRRIHQVHGNTVCLACSNHSTERLTGDALITDEPGVLLMTRHADCPSILIWDRNRHAVGLAHSGRKGTLANIAAELVRAMQNAYGSRPADLEASLGPGISCCCYEIRSDVFGDDEQADRAGPFIVYRGDRMFLDQYGMITHQLGAEGLGAVYGTLDAECTCCGPTRLHSYRRDRNGTNFAALAGIR